MIRSTTLLCASLLSSAAFAAPVNYTFDMLHSLPHFSVEHFQFSTVRGRFDRMSGKAIFDQAAKTGSIEIRIPTASVNTGDPNRGDGKRSRDDILKAPEFFNSAEFPEMIFRSTKLNFKGDDVESVDGTLTLLGVTKPVKLNAVHFKCGPNPFNKKPMCGGEFEATIKRSDWGMKFGVPVAVSDNVKLNLGFEAYAD